MDAFVARAKNILSSKAFFIAVLVFFVFESAWIALSAAYPQAFDEQFHFGLIKIYSHYWLPFLSHQPANSNAYGAVARDPSYLYHYLMSFPYRLISLFTRDQTIQVIILRLINVGFAATSLVLSRQLLIKLNFSKAFSNSAALIYSLIPVVPQLAGQINYDNLLFPLATLSFLLMIDAINQLRVARPRAVTLLTLIAICFVAVLVQYEFFPILVVIWLFLIYLTIKGSPRKIWIYLKADWLKLHPALKAVLVGCLLVSLVLFSQRDLVNLYDYHTLSPNCSKVLSVSDCNAYNVWQASYNWHQAIVDHTSKLPLTNPLAYSGEWFYWLWYRLFFAVNGPFDTYRNYPPLPLPAAAAAIVGFGGTVLSIIYWRIFRKNIIFQFLIALVGLYMFFLWCDGYLLYRYTHVMVLMNGRYLLPITFPAIAVFGLASYRALSAKLHLKIVTALVLLVMFLEGGGLLTFIARSDSRWDLNNTAVVRVNNAARDVLRLVVFEGPKSYSTSVWLFN